MLIVSIENSGDVTVLRCVGSILVGDEVETLRGAVLSQTASPPVVLDLARVNAIDAGGIGLLVFLRAWAQGLGTEFKLMNVSPHLRKLLKLTKLDSMFDIHSPEDRTWRDLAAILVTESHNRLST
jgi:anti-sigma B factor antagonist